MSPIRTHVFIADPELCTDTNGRRFGRCCPLPENNACHQVPERPPDDWSDRVLGERQCEWRPDGGRGTGVDEATEPGGGTHGVGTDL